MAEEIPLPQDLNAKAFVLKSEKDGLWEKSLIVLFNENGTMQRRRVLSTADAFADSVAVVNHSAHPLIWKEVCEKMKTDEEVGRKVYEAVAEALEKQNGFKRPTR